MDALGNCCSVGDLGCDQVCYSGREFDCNSVCGGTAQLDCAGVCGGSAAPDCNGVCGGSAAPDCTGACGGSAVRDCAGTCNGSAVLDCSGQCGGGKRWDNCNNCLLPSSPEWNSCNQVCQQPSGYGNTFAAIRWACIHGPFKQIQDMMWGPFQRKKVWGAKEAHTQGYDHWDFWNFNPGWKVQSDVICGCVRDYGCFDPATPITLADGSVKLAKDVTAGDQLLNPVTGQALTGEQIVESGEDKPLVALEAAGRVIQVSDGHAVLTRDRGRLPAGDLSLNDHVLGADGEWHRIETLRLLPLKYGQRVINFFVAAEGDQQEHHMLDSNGIVTGDLFLQRNLALSKR